MPSTDRLVAFISGDDTQYDYLMAAENASRPRASARDLLDAHRAMYARQAAPGRHRAHSSFISRITGRRTR
jgi:hypothetical protein